MQKFKLTPPQIDPQELLETCRQACDSLIEKMATKNCQYATGPDGYNDGFRNFTRAERSGGLKAERGILLRLDDKTGRIESFLNNSGTPVEKVVSDCYEAANYWLILGALIQKRAEKTKGKPLSLDKDALAEVGELDETENEKDEQFDLLAKEYELAILEQKERPGQQPIYFVRIKIEPGQLNRVYNLPFVVILFPVAVGRVQSEYIVKAYAPTKQIVASWLLAEEVKYEFIDYDGPTDSEAYDPNCRLDQFCECEHCRSQYYDGPNR